MAYKLAAKYRLHTKYKLIPMVTEKGKGGTYYYLMPACHWDKDWPLPLEYETKKPFRKGKKS